MNVPTHLIVISGNIKSMAFGLEAARQIFYDKRESVAILDFSRISHLTPRSYKRKCFIREFSKTHHFDLQKVKITRLIYYFFLSAFWSKDITPQIPNYRNIVLSLTAHHCRSSDVDPGDINIVRRLLWDFKIIATYIEIHKWLNCRIVGLHLFNGRKVVESTVLSAILANDNIRASCKINIYERASTEDKYEVFFTSPHNNREWQNKIEAFAKRFEEQLLSSNTNALFLEYLKLKTSKSSFLTGDDWSDSFRSRDIPFPEKRYVAFFSTSTYEITPIEQFRDIDPFASQLEAVNQLQQICSELSIPLVIRRHPSSRRTHGRDFEKRLWKEIVSKNNVYFIDADDLQDSYNVATGALLSFCWKSSIGIELVARGLACYTLAVSKYDFDEQLLVQDAFAIRNLITNSLQEDVEVLSSRYDAEMLAKRFFFFALNHGKV